MCSCVQVIKRMNDRIHEQLELLVLMVMNIAKYKDYIVQTSTPHTGEQARFKLVWTTDWNAFVGWIQNWERDGNNPTWMVGTTRQAQLPRGGLLIFHVQRLFNSNILSIPSSSFQKMLQRTWSGSSSMPFTRIVLIGPSAFLWLWRMVAVKQFSMKTKWTYSATKRRQYASR